MECQLLRDSVSEALWQLGEDFLVYVCRYLKCETLDSGEPRRTRRVLIKMAESRLDDIEGKEEEEHTRQLLKNLLEYIENYNRGCEQAHEPSEQPNHLQTTSKSPQMNQLDSRAGSTTSHRKEVVEEKYPQARNSLQSMIYSPLRSRLESRVDPARALPEVTLRREFKISGQIGERGQKEKLSYLSLVRQVELGLDKGHTDTEIVEAVIRAVSPGLPLRDMLEMKRGLTLTPLLTILKGHYKVDSSTDLYHQLINIAQEPRETALNFVFRAMELKEKLLWKGENEENEDQYSQVTIQRQFLRSIETGLFSDSVKFHIRPYLTILGISDEELIEKVNEAAKVENERQEKRKRYSAVKNPKVQALQVDRESDSDPTHTQNDVKPKESNSAVAVKTVKGKDTKPDSINTQQIMEELRTEMKQMFLEVMETARRPPGSRLRERGCQRCREENKGESCAHCYRCGQEGHSSRGCRAQRTWSGNEQGLSRRDHR